MLPNVLSNIIVCCLVTRSIRVRCTFRYINVSFVLLCLHIICVDCGLTSRISRFLMTDIHTYRRPCTRSRSLVIGNIHVLFNPNRGDIKLGQVFSTPIFPELWLCKNIICNILNYGYALNIACKKQLCRFDCFLKRLTSYH